MFCKLFINFIIDVFKYITTDYKKTYFTHFNCLLHYLFNTVNVLYITRTHEAPRGGSAFLSGSEPWPSTKALGGLW